ncbi:hypothetical protein [Streptomyces odonnellii]|nr:hypothetical protein [Streptomyces odonnellii]
MTHGSAGALCVLAPHQVSPNAAGKWLGPIRPQDLAEPPFDRAMFTWRCG